MSQVYFGWVESAVQFPEDLDLPQFSLIGTLQEDCSTNYTTGAKILTSLYAVLMVTNSRSV